MKIRYSISILLLIILSIPQIMKGDDIGDRKGNFTISGTIKDASNGEKLAGATVYIKEIKNGTVSNDYGFYSITLPKSTYHLVVNYIGYDTYTKEVKLEKSQKLNIKMTPSAQSLKEVEITSKAKDGNVRSTEMGVVKMDAKTISKIPAFLGEVDVLKTIQLLPGVVSTGEGGTGYSVRGGGTDQNLILLDEAQVYNASHLMGFFSVFNNDAIKDIKLYKGDMPAEHGGRLASLLEIHQKEGNNRKYGATGGLGLISSRLMLEGPIKEDKVSFLVAGRRSYADLFIPLSPREEIQGSKLYFYDLNFKVNADINDKNRVFASGYLGRDVIKMDNGGNFGLDWGNQTFSMRWNHVFGDRLFSNLTLVRSNYDYKMEGDNNNQVFSWKSQMTNNILKYDYGFFMNPNNTIKFGAYGSVHQFKPGGISVTLDDVVTSMDLPGTQALEYGFYVENEQKIGALLSLNYGLRYTVFQNIGASTVYNFDNEFNSLDSTVYAKNEIYNTYDGWEPRIALTYLLSETSSLKASYSRTMQFVQLASNSTVGNPFSIWFPASPNVKPQYGDQASLGYFRNFKNNMFETSVEVFYKKMYNQIDFKDHAQLLMNPQLEGELRFGEGEAYGIELFVRKNVGKLTGWISYTFSKSTRYFKDINNGNSYRSPFEKPHDLAIVTSYEISPRVSASVSWVYSSGSPATFPTGRFIYGNTIAPVYTDRNDFQLPAYHRMDVGVTLNEKPKPNRKWHHSWVFSVYNAYNHHNTYSISFEPSESNPNETVAVKTYLFGIIPSVTFNFNF